MATPIIVSGGFVLMLLILVGVTGAVKRRERFAYVAGILLIMGGLSLLSGTAGAIVAVAGFVAIGASVVPLLWEESPG